MKEPIQSNLFDFQAKASSWRYPAPGALSDPFFFKAAHYWTEDQVYSLTAPTDLDDDEVWRPVRPLGEGGFGCVGLWQKFDRNGTVIDSMAIKQQKYLNKEASQAGMALGAYGLTKEAALMLELN